MIIPVLYCYSLVTYVSRIPIISYVHHYTYKEHLPPEPQCRVILNSSHYWRMLKLSSSANCNLFKLMCKTTLHQKQTSSLSLYNNNIPYYITTSEPTPRQPCGPLTTSVLAFYLK